MPITHVLIFIHGMTTVRGPWTHAEDYQNLWKGLLAQNPAFAEEFTARIEVEWGHRPPDVPFVELRDDQVISDAEDTLYERVAYENVQADASPQNHVLRGWKEPFSKMVTRRVTDPVKEKVEIFGVTDVIYYCSAEGEQAVRAAVYSQILSALAAYEHDHHVRLHFVGHGLGATIAHDFLFGLFAPDEELTGGRPGYLTNPKAPEEDRSRYGYWRERALCETLSVGGFATTAGLLPLTLMRKQSLVNRIADGERLDARVIGITPDSPVRWRIFYDVDDILAFPLRRLYEASPAIEEFQVDTNWRPDLTHAEYWTHPAVVSRIAELLTANLG